MCKPMVLWLSTPNKRPNGLSRFLSCLSYLIRLTYNSHAVPMLLFFTSHPCLMHSSLHSSPCSAWPCPPSVTIFLLFHNLLLFVCSRRVHILFGMCRYDYISLLLVVHPFHSRLIVLWVSPRRSSILPEGDISSFHLTISMDPISTARLSCA